MAAARSLHDGDLAVVRPVGPVDQVELGHELELARIGQMDAFEHLGDEVVRIVEELLHSIPPLIEFGFLIGGDFRRGPQTG